MKTWWQIAVVLGCGLMACSTGKAQYAPGQRVDVSFTMIEAGWQTGCTFVSGPHAENNGYNLVRCGDLTSWAQTRWIRPGSASVAVAAPAVEEARPTAASAPRVVARGRQMPRNAGATAPDGKPCAAGTWANCTPAGGGASTATHLPVGVYGCFLAGRASTMTMSITSGSTYKDAGGNAGSYAFDAASQRITFTSGSLKGKNSKFLPGNKIGLTDNAENFYPTTCDLR